MVFVFAVIACFLLWLIMRSAGHGDAQPTDRHGWGERSRLDSVAGGKAKDCRWVAINENARKWRCQECRAVVFSMDEGPPQRCKRAPKPGDL